MSEGTENKDLGDVDNRLSTITIEKLQEIAAISSIPTRVETSDRLPLHLQDGNLKALREEYLSRKGPHEQKTSSVRIRRYKEMEDKDSVASNKNPADDPEHSAGHDMEKNEIIPSDVASSDQISGLSSVCFHILEDCKALFSRLWTYAVNILSVDDDYSSG